MHVHARIMVSDSRSKQGAKTRSGPGKYFPQIHSGMRASDAHPQECDDQRQRDFRLRQFDDICECNQNQWQTPDQKEWNRSRGKITVLAFGAHNFFLLYDFSPQPLQPRPVCMGGHLTSPKEQNTQQSPGLGCSTTPHPLQS